MDEIKKFVPSIIEELVDHDSNYFRIFSTNICWN